MINYQEIKKMLYEDLAALVDIPSIAKSDSLFKYGSGCAQALQFVIDRAIKMGFSAYLDQNYAYGYIDYYTIADEKTFGIYCHLDVVPAGDLALWKTKPFVCTFEPERIVGRGVLDSKAPTLVNLYALYALKQNGFQPKHNIRLILGVTEETTWESIGDYKSKELIPEMGYTPDAKFPLVYAEKASMYLCIYSDTGDDNLQIISKKTFKEVCSLIDVVQAGKKVTVTGRSCHASHPERGVNALLEWLKVNVVVNPLLAFVKEYLLNDYNCQKMFAQPRKKELRMTASVGYCEIDDKHQEIGINFRYFPHLNDQAMILKCFSKTLQQYNLHLKIVESKPGMHINPNSVLPKKLLNAYLEVMHTHAVPLTMGGGSYAQAFPNTVAFGPVFDSAVGTAHEANEYIPTKWMEKAFEIYYCALQEF